MSSACHGRESILHALHRSWRAHMEQPCYSYWMCEGIVSVRLWCGSWSSPSCHMTSARLSLTLLLSLVLALKAAELKRCCGDKQARRREAIMLLLIILWECSSVQMKTSEVPFTFSNLEILLPLTAVSRMIGGPRPNISLSRELNCEKNPKR